MESSSSSVDQEVLLRPHWGPYSESWRTLFDSALARVLDRPGVVNPPDVQLPAGQLEASLESQRDILVTTLTKKIDRIKRRVEELHDDLIKALANDESAFEQLAHTIQATDLLMKYISTANADQDSRSKLGAYVTVLDTWLKDPKGKPPLGWVFLPTPKSAQSFELTTQRSGETLRQLYHHQYRLLEVAQRQARQDRAFRAKEEELSSLRRDLDEEFEILLAQEANKEINRARKAADQPTMSIPSIQELRESLTNKKPVTTSAFVHLDSMIRDRREGSFGIAGPRGVGKSTMIEFFTAGGSLADEDKDSERPRLGVLVSAPVVYDAREFVLHLYAEVCRKVAGGRAVEADQAKPASPYSLPRTRATWMMAASLASLIFAGGLLAAAVRHRMSAGSTLLADIGALALAMGLVIGFAIVPWVAKRAYRPNSVLVAWTVPYATIISSGGLVLFLSNGSWGTGEPFVLGCVTLAATSLLLLGASRMRQIRTFPQDWETSQNPVVELALERLREIRIQQSSTTERSIMLKVSGTPLPLGVDAGGKTGTTWQHRPKSYPELVSDLRAFLTAAQEHYELIIGVDELDKMAKADKVEDFLNDIKGVFGVTGCFFLVSVSEDAAAGFERRGVPFRDVFDSSFDDVISVPYLDFTMAREVLYGLIIGWTQPFVALCYVMSGGLARDLVRSTRELVGYRDKDNRIDLEIAALGMCRREAGSRLRAIRHELMRDPNLPQSVELLVVIAEYTTDDANVDAFRTWQAKLHEWSEANSDTDGRTAARLALELAAFILFVTTVVEFFNPDTIAERLKITNHAGSLPNLANARRTIAMSPRMSMDSLIRFRSAWDLN